MACKPTLTLLFVLLLGLCAIAADDKPVVTLDGVWLPSSAELAGQKFPDEIRMSLKLVVDGENYTVTVGKKVDKGTVKQNATANPKTMDITGTEGPNKGKTLLAIYELNGDTLRVCYDLSGMDRPKEFASSAEQPYFLVTYEREKNKPAD